MAANVEDERDIDSKIIERKLQAITKKRSEDFDVNGIFFTIGTLEAALQVVKLKVKEIKIDMERAETIIHNLKKEAQDCSVPIESSLNFDTLTSN